MGAGDEVVSSDSTELVWRAAARVAEVRYRPGVTLTGRDGVFLVETLAAWVGDVAPFGVLADARDLRGTDAEYRARASAFFRGRRRRAAIALVNLGPVIAVLVEMFRVGTGIRLKTFADEAEARAWLRVMAEEAT